MTKEPILIDDVDVSGCEFYIDSKNLEFNCKQTPQSYFCKNKPNCHYKQLKHKEQECEELKEKVNSYNCSTNCYKYQQADNYKQALQEIKQLTIEAKTKQFVDMEDFWEQILQKCEKV